MPFPLVTPTLLRPGRRRILLAGAGASASLLAAAPLRALAAGYPERPITFICPWPVGGTADQTMRALCVAAARTLGQSVVVENRAGAAGMLGLKALAAAKPDGYTVGQIPISVARFSQLGSVAIDPMKDLTYLARTSGQTFGIAVPVGSPWKSLADLVAAAKANPGKHTYGSSGVGGATHVGMEEFAMSAGIQLNHIPFKGGADALQAVLGGHVEVLVDSSSWAPLVQAGKLRLLATWGEKRTAVFKDVPTLKDAGFNVVVDAPNGVGAPRGLDPAVAARLREAFRMATASPEFTAACERIDAPVMYLDGPDYQKYVATVVDKEKLLIERLKLKELLAKGVIGMATVTASPLIRLHAGDNILVARENLALGAHLPEFGLRLRAQVPAGHKIAAQAIGAGEAIRKYDTVIGFAARAIEAGEHVHTHNLRFEEFDRDPQFCTDVRPVAILAPDEQARFMGIVRPDGRVATRNYIGILSTVNCSATVSRRIADTFSAERLAAYPNVDGVVAFTHNTGCGMSTPSLNFDVFRRTLAGFARHPNLAAVLVVGLGCERNQIADLLESQGLAKGPLLVPFNMQDIGGTLETIAHGVALIDALLPQANAVRREPVSASHLSIGLQCGGSDGFSSISANPALGAAMDILVRHGGTAILSETPEIYGVEHMLTRRAVTPEVGRALLARIAWWQEYSRGQSGQMNGVVVAGNQAGGIANIFEKSLGSAMKGGTTPLNAVYEFAEPIRERGFVFMDSPGFDPCSATGQIASGANLICFTTGRGSMFGAKPVPSIKLASNTPMFERLKGDMDINCGVVIDGKASVAELGEAIFQHILRTASGETTRSEELGLGDNEFVPWQLGIVT